MTIEIWFLCDLQQSQQWLCLFILDCGLHTLIHTLSSGIQPLYLVIECGTYTSQKMQQGGYRGEWLIADGSAKSYVSAGRRLP
jgi:hypothetical protein